MAFNNAFFILTAAHLAAEAACKAEVARRPERENDFDCGFAWVIIDGREPLANFCRAEAKKLRATGQVREAIYYGDKGYPRGWQFWKPGNHMGQSMRVFEAGARAFRDELAKHGIRATVGSRLD